MRLCAGFKDMRPACTGLHRPKSASHQAYGWSLGTQEQRLDVSSLKPAHVKRSSNALCISASSSSSSSAKSLLCEEEIFQFDSGLDLQDNKQPKRIFKMEGLIPAQGLAKSEMEGHLGSRAGMLKMSLKQSAPVEVPCLQKPGAISSFTSSSSSSGPVQKAKAKTTGGQTQPIDIPGFMTPPAASSHGRTIEKESFVPPHILVAQMTNSDSHFPNSCRRRGLSSLRHRTAVLAETGYLDGYTEMGQRPCRDHTKHQNHELCAQSS